jgi:uncharacterized protein (DUF983 family)
MLIIIGWLVLCFVISAAAGARGRSAVGYFLLSLVLSPLVGLIILWASGTNIATQDRESVSRGEKRKCPACAELVLGEARKCRYCGEALTPTYSPEEAQKDRYVGAMVFVLFLALVGVFVMVMQGRNNDSAQATVTAAESPMGGGTLEATFKVDGNAIELSNAGSTDWNACDVSLNLGATSDSSYDLKLPSLLHLHHVRLATSDFINADQGRFDATKDRLRSVYLHCGVPGGEGTYSGRF